MNLEQFVESVGPEFKGRAQAIGDALGSHDLDEIIKYMQYREDWTDLEEAGFKKLHVNKLHAAVKQEHDKRDLLPPVSELEEQISEVQPDAPPPAVAPTDFEPERQAVPEMRKI